MKAKATSLSITIVFLLFFFLLPFHAIADQAFESVKKIALSLGDPSAQFLVGHMYFHGQGTKIDIKQAAFWYHKSAKQGHSKANYYLALMYLNGQGVQQNTNRAIRLLNQAGDKNENALFKLGEINSEGKIVQLNREKAFLYYQKAASNRHPGAAYALGLIYLKGKEVNTDLKKAKKYLQIAKAGGIGNAQQALQQVAERQRKEKIQQSKLKQAKNMLKQAKLGNPDAQYKLAMKYIEHEDGKKREQGLIWLSESAIAGHNIAQYQFGYYYEYGLHTQQDFVRAAKWYSLAANQGEAHAQFRLGILYLDGAGVKENKTKALTFLQLAKVNGIHEAGPFIDKITNPSQSVSSKNIKQNKKPEKNEIKQNTMSETQSKILNYGSSVIYKLYLEAAQGVVESQYALGAKLFEGKAIKKDPDEAKKWILKAADKGHIQAQILMGYLSAKGISVKLSLAQAARWYHKAARQGNVEAQYRLAVLYDRWNTLRKNKELALKWYKKAADNGHKKAKKVVNGYR